MAKKIEIFSEGKNYTAGNLGNLEQITDYVFSHPALPQPVPGKVFLAESLKTTGMEVSLQIMPPGMGIPFFHKHRKNEEMYIVIKGSGEFQVDETVFPVKEGSVVRVATEGSRCWKNTSDKPMLVIIIQTVAGTLKEFLGSDGYFS